MDYAIIGEYASSKMLITEFNIQRDNVKQVQQSSRRKIIGEARQSISINISGYLRCTSFADLEEEIEKLQAALNKPEIKLVIGSKPSVYYLVSWNGSGLDRKAGAGGYVLPFSLDFEGLEDSAVKALPCALGWVNGPVPVTSRGDYALGTLTAPSVGSIFTSIALPENSSQTLFTLDSYSLTATKSTETVLTLSLSGAVLMSVNVFNKDAAIVGLSFDNKGITIWYEGTDYRLNRLEVEKPSYLLSNNQTASKAWEAVLEFAAPKEYVVSVIMAGIPVIKVAAIENFSVITNAGTAKAPASLISLSGTASFSGNDFGCVISDLASTHYVFNGIESEIYTSNPSSVGGISYLPFKKTLLPYLTQGKNVYSRITGGVAVLSWNERYY